MRALLERVLAAPPRDLEKEIVVVDDASTDGSAEILRAFQAEHPEVRLLLKEVNQGKGAALRDGKALTTGDFVVIQDADLEYDPACYPELLAPILAGEADVVYGSRFAGGRTRAVLMFHHELGNRLLTLLSNLATNLNLTDMETCYKVFRGEDLRAIPVQARRFGFEPEITAKVAKLGLRVYEVPIAYHGRSYAAGKKIGWRDGVSALWHILWYWCFDGFEGADEGLRNLLAMRHAANYNAWTMERLQPWMGQRVLEAGCGIGSLTHHMVGRERLVAVDVNPDYVSRLRSHMMHSPNVRIEAMDLTDSGAYDRLLDEDLDTVLCSNVLEHLPDDDQVLRDFHRVLRPGGRAVVLVPFGAWMYGTLDEAIDHQRRYDRRDLAEKMVRSGFEVEAMFGFNHLAWFGWVLNGKLLKRRTLPSGQVRLFDMVVPGLRLVDSLLPFPPLSIVGVGRKPVP